MKTAYHCKTDGRQCGIAKAADCDQYLFTRGVIFGLIKELGDTKSASQLARLVRCSDADATRTLREWRGAPPQH